MMLSWLWREEFHERNMALWVPAFRDGQTTREKLAKEFCKQGGSEEVQLYQAHGAEVVGWFALKCMVMI